MQVEDGVGGGLVFCVLRVGEEGCHCGLLALQIQCVEGLYGSGTGVDEDVPFFVSMVCQ